MRSPCPAKADLAVLAQALEAYKQVHGDYPWTDTGNAANLQANGQRLFDALLGWTTFQRVGAITLVDELTGTEVPANGPRRFIDPDKIYFDGTELPSSPNTQPGRDNTFVDPWGNPYVYIYGKQDSASNTWQMFGYHLYSRERMGIRTRARLIHRPGAVQTSGTRMKM